MELDKEKQKSIDILGQMRVTGILRLMIFSKYKLLRKFTVEMMLVKK